MWLAIVGGALASLAFVFSVKSDAPYNVNALQVLPLLLVMIGGALFGLFHLYFGGWLYRLTGSWIGGKGSFTEVKSAVGWSNYPYIISSLLSILTIVFKPYLWVQALFGLLNFVVIIWALVIFLNLLSEAHKFSIWKGIVAVLIASALIFVVVIIIALVIPLLTPLFQ